MMTSTVLYVPTPSNYLGGYTQIDSKLDFSGKALYTLTSHKRTTSDTELTTKDTFTYSAQDRLLTHTQQINGGLEQLIASNTYDELGQLTSKKVGGNDSTGAIGLQKVDYNYNIRGWLKGINDTANLTQPNQPDDLFAFKINYNDYQSQGLSDVQPQALFNGNISSTYWKTSNDNFLRKYNYSYDNLNRLLLGSYLRPDTGVSSGRNFEESLQYDKNGNITHLERFDDLEKIDNLNYTYDVAKYKNQLMKVKDGSNSPQGFKDDSDGITDSANDYTYDANGNMTKDDNKGITSITYNHLNLPVKIFFGTNTIEYIYNATGQKIGKKVTEAGNSTITDYLTGGFQYSNSFLQFFPHAEGYVTNVLTSTDCPTCRFKPFYSLNYVFNYTDHLGNVRLSYAQENGALKILEENSYYPFGLKHTRNNVNSKMFVETNGTTSLQTIGELTPYTTYFKNNYKYNGKELQDELGLNMYDYGARLYDPARAGWSNIDPKAENSRRWSPYNYCYNNPIHFVDPDGMQADDWRNKDGKLVYDAKKQEYTKNATAQDKKFGEALRNSGPDGKKQFDALTKSDAKIKVDFMNQGGWAEGVMGELKIDKFTVNDGNVKVTEATLEVYLGEVNEMHDKIMSGEVLDKKFDPTKTQLDNYDVIKSNNLSKFDMAVAVFGHEIAHSDNKNAQVRLIEEGRMEGKNLNGVNSEVIPQKTENKILREIAKNKK